MTMQRPTKLNLLYHITGLHANDVWLRNIAQLKRRWSVFTGRKIISVATGDGFASLEQAQRRFWDCPGIEWLQFPNDIALRECVSWYPMLELIASTDPDEAFFYAHAKGVTRSPHCPRITAWRNNMDRHLLDDPGKVQDALENHPCVGCYRMFHRPGTLRGGHLTEWMRKVQWHYAGTFFWCRHDRLFSQDWRKVSPHGWAVEFYLSQFFSHPEAACLFADNPPDPYKRAIGRRKDPEDWRKYIEPPRSQG